MVALERNGSAALLPKLAFLGPVGTYSHQAAYDKFSDAVEYHACQTIADVFDSVDAAFPLGLLPQENSIFGAVTETYDLLRSPEVGKTKWVRGAVTLAVQHCLVVREGRTLADIRKILSHEQALGQCRQFIAAHVPGAVLVKVPSTAAAAQAVSSNPGAADSAAICSKICADLFPDLELLHEGIQNENDNHTRFYVLANSPAAPLPAHAAEGLTRHALVRIEAESTGPPEPITRLLAALRLPASRIDRRPSIQPACSQSVYFVEVEDDEITPLEVDSEDDDRRWAQKVQDGAQRVREAGGRSSVLGTW